MGKQLIIIGGGDSINEATDLWDKLKNKFTIAINYSYNHIRPTILFWGDKKFYLSEYDKLKTLPLTIGIFDADIKPLSNTILIQDSHNNYYRDLKYGIYKSSLSGLAALSLGIYLLDIGEIYLLGYSGGANKRDKNGNWITHYYNIQHSGVGKVDYYHTENKLDRDFGVYKAERRVKIFNVGLNSKINTFEKIDYDTFFDKLNNDVYDQNDLRLEIVDGIKKELKDVIIY